MGNFVSPPNWRMDYSTNNRNHFIQTTMVKKDFYHDGVTFYPSKSKILIAKSDYFNSLDHKHPSQHLELKDIYGFVSYQRYRFALTSDGKGKISNVTELNTGRRIEVGALSKSLAVTETNLRSILSQLRSVMERVGAERAVSTIEKLSFHNINPAVILAL